MKIIFKYIKLAFKESPWLIMLGMLFIIVFRLLQFGMDLSLKFATDSILSATSYTGIILPFILFFCAMMLGGNTGNFNNFLITLYTKKTEKFFTKRFMERTYQEKQDSFYDATFYNKYAFVKNNIQETYQLTVTICSKLFSAIVSLIITATTISFLNPLLFLIVLVVSVLIVCINYFIINKRKKLAQTYTEEERRAAYYGDLLSNRNHAKELRIFHLQDFFLKRWKDSYGKYKKVYYSFDQKSMILQNIPGIVEQILAGVMIIFFLYETVTGSISVGDFVLLYRLMWRISWSIESIVSILSGDLLQNYTYIKEYDQFTKNNGKEAEQKQSASVSTDNFESLELRDVSYSYPAQEGNAVNHVNFTLKKGEIVAVLGYNGSGKSTLSKIICGLLEDYQGQILYNGMDYKLYAKEKTFPMFGIAFQDFTRYAFSLHDNIAVGMVEMCDCEDEVLSAVKKSDLFSLISELPLGINTILGKEYDSTGTDLSGGQWQRIILARAHMGNPSILIFDEPTASIDPLQEMQLLQDLRNQIKGQTAILISHRIGFARLSDRICVMENGEIAETGTHDELINKNGVYASLYHAQKQLYDEEGVDLNAK